MFTSLVSALSPFFMHPLMFAVGSTLVASPIIIHLINRMRFRKVRFAAMEFLLQAQQRNRRRLLLEQLLLLLLRILIVLAILALLARLILDPRLTVFGGEGKAHHLVVLDDSASMWNRWGDTTAFEEAKKVIRKLVREGAKRPQTQKFSMVLLSKPNDFFIAEKDVDDELLRDLEDKLENLKPSYRRPDLQAGLEIAGQHLRKDRAVIKYLHVLSDFRAEDWQGKEALGEVMSTLSDDNISINLIRAIDRNMHLPNLGLTTLDGDLHAAAVGVPVRLKIGVTNFGDQVVENVRATVVVDGEKLPLSVSFPKIEGGQENIQIQDLTFNTEGLHRVQIQLEDDSLKSDNERYLSLDIPLANNVLIVTGDLGGGDVRATQNALVPNKEDNITGISSVVVQPDFLRREALSRFRSIYMLNVPEIPLDALPQLEAYVRGGGGLVWFLGENIKVAHYNKVLSKLELNKDNQLVRLEESLFPVMLEDTHAELERDPTQNAPDLSFTSHPIFKDTFGKDSPLIAGVTLTGYMPVVKQWVKDDAVRKDGVTTVGYTRGGAPIAFDQRFGKGRVMTFLTSAGPPWNNLEKTLVFLPLVQELQKYVAKPDEEKRAGRSASRSNWNCPPSITIRRWNGSCPDRKAQGPTRWNAGKSRRNRNQTVKKPKPPRPRIPHLRTKRLPRKTKRPMGICSRKSPRTPRICTANIRTRTSRGSTVTKSAR